MMYSKIVSTGGYLPEIQVDNQDLIQFPKSSIELIELKTGVKSRRHAKEDECTSDLAINAANKCLKNAGFNPQELDAIVLATSSPDRMQPATATRVQYEIGAQRAFAFDINSVCTGSIYGIYLADLMIQSGTCKNVLLVASEVYSKIIDPKDFSTYPYFGDGAGAVLFCKSNERSGVIKSLLHSDGSGADLIHVPIGGTMLPYRNIKSEKETYFKMKGREIYDFAVTRGAEVVDELLRETQVEVDEIKFIIPHQANINIIKELSHKLEISFDKFFVNLDKYGNTAAASILIALDELFCSGKLKKGDLIILVGFGGGLSWGANLISI